MSPDAARQPAPGGAAKGERLADSDHDPIHPAAQEAAVAYLRHVGTLEDSAIDLTEAALQLALLRLPATALEPYRTLLQDMVDAAAARQPSGLAQRADALRAVIAETYGFAGDTETYDDRQNASLIRVLDRRKGLPIALAILYLHVARALDWSAHGLAFPGHFLVAVDGGGGRAILDPFHGGISRGPRELRALVKQAQGPDTELRPEHYAPAENRAILTRLQNNIRSRLVRDGALEPALAVAETVTWFDPQSALAWRDMGILHAELGNLRAAVTTLEESLSCDDRPARRHVTAALIQRLRSQLN